MHATRSSCSTSTRRSTKEKQLEQALRGAHRDDDACALPQAPPGAPDARRSATRARSSGGSRSSAAASDGIAGVVQDAPGVVQEVAAKGAALAQGPVHAVRGTSEQEMLLKNARTEFKEEAEEIAHYTAIQKLAEPSATATRRKLAKAILREEKRMAGFLEKLIPRLTKSVAQAEIPAQRAKRRPQADQHPPQAPRARSHARAARAPSRDEALDQRPQRLQPQDQLALRAARPRPAQDARRRSASGSASTRAQDDTARARRPRRRTSRARAPATARGASLERHPVARRAAGGPPGAQLTLARSPSRTGRGRPPGRSR